MLQRQLKWQLPAPKCCKQQEKRAEKQIPKKSKTEKTNNPKTILDPYIVTQIFESLRDEDRPHPMNRTERKEAGSWWPTGVKLGRPWPKLGRTKLGPTWAEIAPSSDQSAPTWCTASRVRQLEPKLEPIGQVELKLGPKRPRNPKLKPCYAHVGPSQVQHGAAWSCLGGSFAPSWA